MGSGRNLGRSLTMGPNCDKYFTQNFSSILSLACLCASDASVGLPMQCILEVGEKEGESPPTLSGGSTLTWLPNDWSIGCIELEMTDTVTMNYWQPKPLD